MSFLVLVLVFANLVGCASAPPPPPPIDQNALDNAIFNCKKQVQSKKKARFAKLPKLLQRLAGDNQVLKESTTPLTKGDVSRAIAKFPLTGDSGGSWGDAKEAHLRTVSTRFEKPIPPKGQTESREQISLVFGQPGRVYSFPLANLRPSKSGLEGISGDDHLQIASLDEHHVIIRATTSRARNPVSQFHGRDIHAVVRTYVEQNYSQETASQLSDYPVYAPDLNEEFCDQSALETISTNG